ncbi:MAG: hypothetical protein QOC78_49 [Solirubrobacteraceae bacterium]|nr:hypothetical protein [Solirubrobacteraceae bacterium]
MLDSSTAPRNDCRLTLRCLKSATFDHLKLRPEKEFASLRSENTFIDVFFERRENDEAGGERGQRVSQIKTRPAFKMTSGRLRGATWFDTEHPPQDIVWLLGAEMHDERHKGKSDAYDLLAALDDDQGRLWPRDIDYKRAELDRRRWDTTSFAADLAHDADQLLATCLRHRRAQGSLAQMRSRWATFGEGDMTLVTVALSTEPVIGPRSRLAFPLTDRRFLLAQEGCRQAVERTGREALSEEIRDPTVIPGGLRNERAFGILFSTSET